MKFIVLRCLALAAFGAFVACAAGTDINGSSALAKDSGTDDDSGDPTGDDDASPVGDDDDGSVGPDDAGTPPKDSGGGAHKDSGGGAKDSGSGTPDSGGGTPDTGGGGSCSSLPAAVQSGIPACDTCMAANCCATRGAAAARR